MIQESSELPIIIVGAGLSGAVIAERCATVLGKKVIVIDKRPHIAGNCYDYINDDGIMISKYGAHIFHTNDEEVWQYVHRFSDWNSYEHKVLSNVNGTLVPIPINITTVNTLLNLHIETPKQMQQWVESQLPHDLSVHNSEDSALARFGNRKLYELLFKEYTYKQWSLWPKELDASVLERIPIRYDFNDRYFTDTYEGIPRNGYTALVEKMLSHPLIEVRLDTDFFAVKESLEPYQNIVYTGPIDRFFDNRFEKLEYRSLRFEFETIDTPSYQSVAVVNYPSLEQSFTRIVEFKKLYGGQSEKTTIAREYPTWEGEPYYPVPTDENRRRYETYKAFAEQSDEVLFVGRLANYKYFNMDQAIRNALDAFQTHFMHEKEPASLSAIQ